MYIFLGIRSQKFPSRVAARRCNELRSRNTCIQDVEKECRYDKPPPPPRMEGERGDGWSKQRLRAPIARIHHVRALTYTFTYSPGGFGELKNFYERILPAARGHVLHPAAIYYKPSTLLYYRSGRVSALLIKWDCISHQEKRDALSPCASLAIGKIKNYASLMCAPEARKHTVYSVIANELREAQLARTGQFIALKN